MSLYLTKLQLINFKGFAGQNPPITFHGPDGVTPGSGLNILVGENNGGKSTIFAPSGSYMTALVLILFLHNLLEIRKMVASSLPSNLTTSRKYYQLTFRIKNTYQQRSI